MLPEQVHFIRAVLGGHHDVVQWIRHAQKDSATKKKNDEMAKKNRFLESSNSFVPLEGVGNILVTVGGNVDPVDAERLKTLESRRAPGSPM